MKKINILILLAVIAGGVYFTVGQGGAVRYSNQISRYQRQVASKMKSYMRAVNVEKLELMEIRMQELKDTITQNMAKLKETPDFQGNTSLRDMTYKVIEFYFYVAQNEYTHILNFFKSEQNYEMSKENFVFAKIKDVQLRERTLLDELAVVQQKFDMQFNL